MSVLAFVRMFLRFYCRVCDGVGMFVAGAQSLDSAIALLTVVNNGTPPPPFPPPPPPSSLSGVLQQKLSSLFVEIVELTNVLVLKDPNTKKVQANAYLF